MKAYWFVLLCGLVGCTVSLWPKKPTPPFGGILNFAYVDKTAKVYRGGQPDKAGFDWLYEQGVRTIVKLDTEEQGSDSYAESLGILVVRIPITDLEQFMGPVPVDQMKTEAKALTPGTFVHCQHGQDRTGLFVYFYRRLVDGWSKDRAERELMALGFHPELFALERAVKNDPP